MAVDPRDEAAALLLRCASAGVRVASDPPAGTVHAGLLWLRADGEDDLTEAVESTPEARTAGAGPRRLALPRLRGAERPHRSPDGIPLPPWAMRLSRLARQVRDTLGDAGWTLRWADDGRVWLMGIGGPEPPRRQETLVRLDGGGLIPPGHFGATVITEAAAEFVARWQAHLPLPEGRRLVHVVHARAYLNMSLVEEALRRVGLPTTSLSELGWLPGPFAITGTARAGRRTARLLRFAPALARAVLPPPRGDRFGRGHRRRPTRSRARGAPALPPGPAWDVAGVVKLCERTATAALHGCAVRCVRAAVSHAVPLPTPFADRGRGPAGLGWAEPLRELRGTCCSVADELVSAGRLPSREAWWLLHPGELLRAGSGWTVPGRLLGERAAELSDSAPAWLHAQATAHSSDVPPDRIQ